MSQTTKLLALLQEGRPVRTDEILEKVYGSDHLGCARISARIKDLRDAGHNIPKAVPDKDKPSLSWYVLKLGNEKVTVEKENPSPLSLHSQEGTPYLQENTGRALTQESLGLTF